MSILCPILKSFLALLPISSPESYVYFYNYYTDINMINNPMCKYLSLDIRRYISNKSSANCSQPFTSFEIEAVLIDCSAIFRFILILYILFNVSGTYWGYFSYFVSVDFSFKFYENYSYCDIDYSDYFKNCTSFIFFACISFSLIIPPSSSTASTCSVVFSCPSASPRPSGSRWRAGWRRDPDKVNNILSLPRNTAIVEKDFCHRF